MSTLDTLAVERLLDGRDCAPLAEIADILVGSTCPFCGSRSIQTNGADNSEDEEALCESCEERWNPREQAERRAEDLDLR